MSDLMSGTVKRLFPKDFEEVAPGKQPWWQKIDLENLKSFEALLVLLVILLVAVPGIHYWNRLITLYTNTRTAEAQIKVIMQRRKDLSINLTTTLIDFAERERILYQYTIDARHGTPKKNRALLHELKKTGLVDLSKQNLPKPDLAANLVTGKLIALAEAYPDLKLSGNFQKMMDALIATEDKLAERRMFYNE